MFCSNTESLSTLEENIPTEKFNAVINPLLSNETFTRYDTYEYNSIKHTHPITSIHSTNQPNNAQIQRIYSPNFIQMIQIQGHGIPLDNDVREKTIITKEFFAMAWSMFHEIIPLGVLITLIHDLILFHSNPDQRYGTTFKDIFIGSASNEQTWSSHFGSYEQGLPLHVWPIIFISPLFLYPFLSIPFRRLSTYSSILVKGQDILWMRSSIDDKQVQLTQLITEFNQGGVKGILSLICIMQIASSFSTHELNLYIADTELKNNLILLRQDALKIIKDTSFVLTLYLQWKTREDRTSLAWLIGIPSILWALYALYANYLYGNALVRKAIFIDQNLQQKRVCNLLNNTYQWDNPSAEYKCTPCPDWPEANNPLTVNECLDTFFEKSLSAEEIISRLSSLGTNRSIQRIDFSKQDWISWPLETFENVLNTLALLCKPGINSLNFSLKDKKILPDPLYYRLIADVINYLAPKEIIMEGLNEPNLQALLRNITKKTNTEILTFSNSFLGDEGIDLIAQYLNDFTELQTLNLANTYMKDLGLMSLSRSLMLHSKIYTLNIANNHWTKSGFFVFSQCWSNHSLKQLDISNNLLTPPMGLVLSKAMQKRPLQKLIAKSCSIDDLTLTNLAKYGVFMQELFLSNNFFTEIGLHHYLEQTIGSPLQILDLTKNKLPDIVLNNLNNTIPQTNIRFLNLSKNPFTAQGLRAFLPGLSLSNIDTLILNDIHFGDEAAYILRDYFNDSHSKLKQLFLNNIGLNIAGTRALFSCKTHLNLLSLNENDLDNAIDDDLDNFLSLNPQLKTLNLAENLLNGTVLNILLSHNVSSLNLNDNPISSEAVFNFTKKLLSPTPHRKFLGNTFISLDERRALREATPTTSYTHIAFEGIALENNTQLAIFRVTNNHNLRIHSQNNNPHQFFAPSTQALATGLLLNPLILGLFVGLALMGGLLLISSFCSKASAVYQNLCSDDSEKMSDSNSVN